MTRTKEEIVKMILEIQSSANLKVDKLVNNANILDASTPELLAEAARILEAVSAELSIPVGFVSGMEEVMSGYEGDKDIEKLYLKKNIRLPWERQ